MKVGSLLECIKDIPDYITHLVVTNRPSPKKGDIETVESIDKDGGLHLVGFTFTCSYPICAVSFSPEYFREVQPPMSLEFIEELQMEEVL